MATVRYTLSDEGIRYVTHRDRAELPTTRGIWSTEFTTDKEGRRPRHVGHRIETWARQTKHADGITWFLSKLEVGDPRRPRQPAPLWSVPTARSDRAYNWGRIQSIAPDARGAPGGTGGLQVPFYLRARAAGPSPQGSYSPVESIRGATTGRQSTRTISRRTPTTLFVVDTEEVEDTYVRTARPA